MELTNVLAFIFIVLLGFAAYFAVSYIFPNLFKEENENSGTPDNDCDNCDCDNDCGNCENCECNCGQKENENVGSEESEGIIEVLENDTPVTVIQLPNGEIQLSIDCANVEPLQESENVLEETQISENIEESAEPSIKTTIVNITMPIYDNEGVLKGTLSDTKYITEPLQDTEKEKAFLLEAKDILDNAKNVGIPLKEYDNEGNLNDTGKHVFQNENGAIEIRENTEPLQESETLQNVELPQIESVSENVFTDCDNITSNVQESTEPLEESEFDYVSAYNDLFENTERSLDATRELTDFEKASENDLKTEKESIVLKACADFLGKKLTAAQKICLRWIEFFWNLLGDGDWRKLANILAQTYHESYWKPIEEYGKGKGKPYGKTGFWGRGLIQITWEDNYKKFSVILNIDFVKFPKLVLEPKNAAFIAVYGMISGSFRKGRNLDKFINGTNCDYYGARDIVNGGNDKATEIKQYSEKLFDCLMKYVG